MGVETIHSECVQSEYIKASANYSRHDSLQRSYFERGNCAEPAMRVGVCVALLLTVAAAVLATKERFGSPEGMQTVCVNYALSIVFR